MDVLRSTKRNGLDGDFFNFVPVAVGAGTIALVKKKRQKKFQNQKANDLAIKYPHKLTSDEQDQTIAQVSDEQRKLVDDKNNSKGAKRSRLNAELKGYDEYLTDLRKVRDELLIKEREAISQLTQQAQVVTKDGVVTEATKQDAIVQSAIPKIEEPTPKPQEGVKSNNLLYIGMGAVILLGIILVMRKK
jgi:hypothetical protein